MDMAPAFYNSSRTRLKTLGYESQDCFIILNTKCVSFPHHSFETASHLDPFRGRDVFVVPAHQFPPPGSSSPAPPRSFSP